MPETYRVRLADGQVFDMHASAAKIRKEHPEGRIVGRIVLDDMGLGSVVPYAGEQPEAVEDAPVEAVEAPQSDEKPKAASTAKSASKKSG